MIKYWDIVNGNKPLQHIPNKIVNIFTKNIQKEYNQYVFCRDDSSLECFGATKNEIVATIKNKTTN